MIAGSQDRKALSPQSIRGRHALLHGIYKWAAGPPHRLSHDPCKGTDLPKRRKGQPKGLRPAEWQALHSMLEQGDQAAADLALFLVRRDGAGLRRLR